ncbi:MAG: hypothetical protein IH840_17600 [Candidatus Heimdallarchaeota archaeon]|nr:hypothetical protein [Candidatus Heimdallarchaeota archaeon]
MDAYQRGAELLLKGAIMLRTACPNCNDPIYKLRDGRLFCATCNTSVIVVDDSEVDRINDSEPEEHDPITKKIAGLSKQLELETNPEKILELAETIRKLQQI